MYDSKMHHTNQKNLEWTRLLWNSPTQSNTRPNQDLTFFAVMLMMEQKETPKTSQTDKQMDRWTHRQPVVKSSRVLQKLKKTIVTLKGRKPGICRKSQSK